MEPSEKKNGNSFFIIKSWRFLSLFFEVEGKVLHFHHFHHSFSPPSGFTALAPLLSLDIRVEKRKLNGVAVSTLMEKKWMLVDEGKWVAIRQRRVRDLEKLCVEQEKLRENVVVVFSFLPLKNCSLPPLIFLLPIVSLQHGNNDGVWCAAVWCERIEWLKKKNARKVYTAWMDEQERAKRGGKLKFEFLLLILQASSEWAG